MTDWVNMEDMTAETFFSFIAGKTVRDSYLYKMILNLKKSGLEK